MTIKEIIRVLDECGENYNLTLELRDAMASAITELKPIYERREFIREIFNFTDAWKERLEKL